MTYSSEIAKQLRQLYLGGNWAGVCLKETIADISWLQATQKISNLNSIALLLYHINYYIHAVLPVFDGGQLNASDKFSFDMPPVNSETDWQNLKDQVFHEAELLASRIENFDESKLLENFEDGKYGSYYRNVTGIIEHTHYHLGQISLIKKLINQNSTTSKS